MISKPKYFILLGGPTGSGKTDLIQAIFTHLGISTETKYDKFIIDDLVENDPFYKKQVDSILSQLKLSCKKTNKKQNCMKTFFQAPSDELFNQFENAYKKTRSKPGGCLAYQKEGNTCDNIFQNRLANYFNKNNKNNNYADIVVLETTGTRILEWLLKLDILLPSTYEIIIGYSLVSIPNLILRNTSRTYETYKKYQSNPTHNPAPRLPRAKKEHFLKYFTTITKILTTLHRNQHHNNRLLIFDNNYSYLNIYDSIYDKQMNTQTFKKLIHQAKD